MKVAIPVWNDRVSPVLDTAARLLVVRVENDQVTSRAVFGIDEKDLTGRCSRIRGLNIDTLICGAVSHPFLRMLLASGLDVIREISGKTDEVLDAYLHGDISHSKFLLPGSEKSRSGHAGK